MNPPKMRIYNRLISSKAATANPVYHGVYLRRYMAIVETEARWEGSGVPYSPTAPFVAETFHLFRIRFLEQENDQAVDGTRHNYNYLLSLLPATYRMESGRLASAAYALVWNIFVTKRMDMHLTWTMGCIFLKPIPRFLLEPLSRRSTSAMHITASTPYDTAPLCITCRHASDNGLGNVHPASYSPMPRQYPMRAISNIYLRIDVRFHYGELRLTGSLITASLLVIVFCFTSYSREERCEKCM
ncbi:hypothetical protein HRG_012904 [Hirsutella rhossiliensis]